MVALPSCYRTKTQTVLIKPPPCEVAAWPELPKAVIYPTDEEGKWTIYEQDRQMIQIWINQVERIYLDLSTCPGVHFNELLP